MSVVRFKYRPAAIQPELADEKKKVKASLSLAKKIKPEEHDPYADGLTKIGNEQTIFLATHTQVKRVEVLISSDEEGYRKKHYPTIEERIEKQKEWARIQLREAKIASEREALKKAQDLKIIALRKQKEAIEEARRDGVTLVGMAEPNIEVDPLIPDEPLAYGGQPLNEGDVDESGNTNIMDENGEINEEYANELMEIKEKKMLATRQTGMYHKEMSKWQKRKLAINMHFGWATKSKNLNYTEILPWLLIGRAEMSTNQTALLQMGITHILNMTNNLPCAFPNTFIYKKIPVRDSLTEDIVIHFAAIVQFIERVEKCKGRILVHCTIGASRAPTAVLAYLVYCKKIPLVDAYNYVCAKRPIVNPNQHFLFELAKFETENFDECSVYFHKDWRFYEFNVFRAEGFPERRRWGMYTTVMFLHTPQEEEDDALQLVEEEED